MYPCQTFNRIVDNSGTNHNDLMGTNSLSEMVELLKRKDWVVPNLKSLPKRRANPLTQALCRETLWNWRPRVTNPNTPWFPNETVLSESRRLGTVIPSVTKLDNPWLQSVLSDLWTWRSLGSFPGGTLWDSALRASPSGIRERDSNRWELEEGFRLPVARSPPTQARDNPLVAFHPSTWGIPPDRTAIPPTEASPKTGHYITDGALFHFEYLLHCADSSHVIKSFGMLYAFETKEMLVVTWPACSLVSGIKRKTMTSLAPSQSHATATILGSVWYFATLRRRATSTA